jgi:hypothetical protein
MTRDKYFTMMEQLEKEPKDAEIPPDLEDLPDDAITAMNVFNSLGDRVYPEIGYTGKDYTTLELQMSLHFISNKEFFLEVLNWLEARAIKKASEQLKREYDKLKRNKNG